MLGINGMSSKEIHGLLPHVKYAHLDCIHQGKRYVVSTQYYIADSDVYLFTTEGVQAGDVDQNPEVCLQVEEICDLHHWRSVVINGRASRLTDPADIDRAMHFIEERNSLLSPAINRTWADALGCPEPMAIYCLHLGDMSGRATEGVSSCSLSANLAYQSTY
jgi:uncharacterized protein